MPEGVQFGVWAPKAGAASMSRSKPTNGPTFHRFVRDDDGIHTGTVPGHRRGDALPVQVDGGDAFPDVRSRFQPEGVHGPSEVIDPRRLPGATSAGPGLTMDDLVIYELHVGTYTPEGTFAALIASSRRSRGSA